MSDIIGKALLDFQNGNYSEDIITYSSLGEEDMITVPYLFRAYNDMPKIEQRALGLCYGKILDVGCGAGSHSVYLQEKGFDVTALDSSKGAIRVCELRALQNTICTNIQDFYGTKFDTLLLLMNGIGIVGNLNRLGNFLNHFKSLLRPRGQILLDSSNIIYMFEQDDDGGYWIPDTIDYYGEVEFQMSYKGLKGKPFHWLYIDFENLKKYAQNHRFACELVSEGKHYDYLAKLTLRP
ncbi:class I SAM-dependent methyltransferase [Croceitalea rosinachiae]|uniref:Class I SAM-dependent methyltransferase n=1 Tax=Croceitalea rosinachiae TaxID=3075596 RepID=A0ABU3AFV3_9FLAO|nr:class I SAM-dependent methyltransferase [Croceitalea sp. F388]MDT0607993.1 class I SAM-dependent methyltransferase [Croceitalea sp. F388]